MSAITIVRFARETIANYDDRGCAGSTIRQVAQVLREISELKNKRRQRIATKTNHFTDATIGAWIKAWPDRTPVTFRSHLRCFRSLCGRAKKKGYLKLNPFAVDAVGDWMRPDSRPSPPKRQWSRPPDDIRRVLAYSSRKAKNGVWEAIRDEAYMHTLFLLGMRPAEVQRLEIADFDSRFRTITIRAKYVPTRGGARKWWKPKTVGSGATMALGKQLVELLERYCRWLEGQNAEDGKDCTWLFPGRKRLGPWTSGGPGIRPLDRVKALGKEAGVPDLWQKSARKGIGTHQDIGLTPQGRRRFFRHADDATGDLYDEQDVESRRADAAKIETFYLFGT